MSFILNVYQEVYKFTLLLPVSYRLPVSRHSLVYDTTTRVLYSFHVFLLSGNKCFILLPAIIKASDFSILLKDEYYFKQY